MVIDNQLNPNKYTEEQLEQNTEDAGAYATATAYAAAAAYAYAAAANAYDATTYADAGAYAAAVDYWLNQYFKQTGENKQDYIDAINKDNK